MEIDACPYFGVTAHEFPNERLFWMQMNVLNGKNGIVLSFLQATLEFIQALDSIRWRIEQNKIKFFYIGRKLFERLSFLFTRDIGDAFASGFRAGIDQIVCIDAISIANFQDGVGLLILNNPEKQSLNPMRLLVSERQGKNRRFRRMNCLQRFEGIIRPFCIQDSRYKSVKIGRMDALTIGASRPYKVICF